jgi:cytochrome c peroxidase
MRKEAVFNEQEQKGYELFKTNCASCHSEPLFTNGKYENNGIPIDTTLNDIGRQRITEKKERWEKEQAANLKSYKSIMKEEKMKSNYDVDASVDDSAAKKFEEDFF